MAACALDMLLYIGYAAAPCAFLAPCAARFSRRSSRRLDLAYCASDDNNAPCAADAPRAASAAQNSGSVCLNRGPTSEKSSAREVRNGRAATRRP